MSKPNKFTQSVLERLAEEQKNDKIKVVEKQNNKKVTPPVVKEEKSSKQNDESSQVEANKPKNTIPDISEFFNKKQNRAAKNKTFYLDVQVIDTLKKVAKQQQTTDSQLCNDILRKVLGLDS